MVNSRFRNATLAERSLEWGVILNVSVTTDEDYVLRIDDPFIFSGRFTVAMDRAGFAVCCQLVSTSEAVLAVSTSER
jgi:hypothetical protein